MAVVTDVVPPVRAQESGFLKALDKDRILLAILFYSKNLPLWNFCIKTAGKAKPVSLPAIRMNPFSWLEGKVVQLIFSHRIYKVFFTHLSLSSDNTGSIKLYKNDITRSIIMSLSLVLTTWKVSEAAFVLRLAASLYHSGTKRNHRLQPRVLLYALAVM